MSLDTTNPPLAPNAAKESGGNLDGLAAVQEIEIAEGLRQLLIEMRIMNFLLMEGLGLQVSLEDLRNDPDFSKVR